MRNTKAHNGRLFDGRLGRLDATLELIREARERVETVHEKDEKVEPGFVSANLPVEAEQTPATIRGIDVFDSEKQAAEARAFEAREDIKKIPTIEPALP